MNLYIMYTAVYKKPGVFPPQPKEVRGLPLSASGSASVCTAEKGSPFGEAENFQALETPKQRSFWCLMNQPIHGQDILELQVRVGARLT